MKKPKVDVIVVKYNQPNFEATTVERVALNTFYPNYTLTAYQNEKGVALSKCWNDLIGRSDADFVCLLNSDTAVTPGWLTGLMDVFEMVRGVGAVVPSSNNVYQSQIRVPFPTNTTDFDAINEFAASNARDGRCVDLPTLSAMCVLFPKVLWEEIGGFNERFHFYGEDAEFFARLKKRTDRLLIWYRGVYVHHYKAQSVSKAIDDGELDYDETMLLADQLCEELVPELGLRHGKKVEA